MPAVSDILTISYLKKERVKVPKDNVDEKDIEDGIVEVLEFDYPYDYEFPYPIGSAKGDCFKKQYRLFFEDLELTNLVDGKLGVNDQFISYTSADYNWLALKEGMIGYRSERIYHIKIKVESITENNRIATKCKFKDVIPLNFVLGKLDLSIKEVYECDDASSIIISLARSEGETLFIIWDLDSNRELKNYSIYGSYTFIRGKKSKYGYILCKNYYVNLEKNIENYFFDYDFTYIGLHWDQPGYKMSDKEELILVNGSFLLKTLVTEAMALNKFVQGEIDFKQENMESDLLKFQIEGNTILHMVCLEIEDLKVVIDYLMEHKKEYLTTILMENHGGKSALDICIDKNSPKTTDILLNTLSMISDGNYSQNFFRKFPQLLDMKLKSFHYFLETCLFQTVQMKYTKYLRLRADDDIIITSHTSCILDDTFFEKHTKEGKAEKEFKQRTRELLQEERSIQQEEKVKASDEPKGQDATKAPEEAAKLPEVATVGGFETNAREFAATPGEAVMFNERAGQPQDSEEHKSSNPDSEDEGSEGDDSSQEISRTLRESDEEEYAGGSTTLQDKLGGILADGKKAAELASKTAKETKQTGAPDDLEKRKAALKENRKKLDKDIKLYRKTQKEGIAKYEVRAVEFDWVFNETEGKIFLNSMAVSGDDEVFEVEVIKKLIEYLWKFYRRAIVLNIFVPFIIYFVLFITYSTWINELRDEESGTGPYNVLNFAMVFIIIGFIFFFLYIEARKIIAYRLRYFLIFWNLVDIISISLNISVLTLDLLESGTVHRIPVLACATFFMWLKLCYFGRMSFRTAWLVRMIMAVTTGMTYLILIFALSIFAFANSFLLLSRMENDEGEYVIPGVGFWEALKFSYR